MLILLYRLLNFECNQKKWSQYLTTIWKWLNMGDNSIINIIMLVRYCNGTSYYGNKNNIKKFTNFIFHMKQKTKNILI